MNRRVRPRLLHREARHNDEGHTTMRKTLADLQDGGRPMTCIDVG